jgi:hypothetical protein
MSAVSARSGRRSPRSATLGARLRNVLVSPRVGFTSALRKGGAQQATRSFLLVLVVLLDGVATMALWLKITGITQLAERTRAEASWGAVLAAVLLGAAFGAFGYLLWGWVGGKLIAQGDGGSSRDRLRLVWAFAVFPLAAYALVFLPLDLLLVGPEIFSTDRLDGSFAMVWAALSVAIGVSAAAWSGYLFWRGVEVVTGERGRRVFGSVALATACAGLLYAVILLREVFA